MSRVTSPRRHDMKTKCLPSGKNAGQRCASSFVVVSRVVTGAGSPPFALTRNSGERSSGENKIVPSVLHAPPYIDGASAISSILPLERSTVLSFPPEENPSDIPSGDQKRFPNR